MLNSFVDIISLMDLNRKRLADLRKENKKVTRKNQLVKWLFRFGALGFLLLFYAITLPTLVPVTLALTPALLILSLLTISLLPLIISAISLHIANKVENFYLKKATNIQAEINLLLEQFDQVEDFCIKKGAQNQARINSLLAQPHKEANLNNNAGFEDEDSLPLFSHFSVSDHQAEQLTTLNYSQRSRDYLGSGSFFSSNFDRQKDFDNTTSSIELPLLSYR